MITRTYFEIGNFLILIIECELFQLYSNLHFKFDYFKKNRNLIFSILKCSSHCSDFGDIKFANFGWIKLKIWNFKVWHELIQSTTDLMDRSTPSRVKKIINVPRYHRMHASKIITDIIWAKYIDQMDERLRVSNTYHRVRPVLGRLPWPARTKSMTAFRRF
jgi:hypothetical protein